MQALHEMPDPAHPDPRRWFAAAVVIRSVPILDNDAGRPPCSGGGDESDGGHRVAAFSRR
jgi:hypothetical protein